MIGIDPAQLEDMLAGRARNKPGFSWERNGEALLREHKPWSFGAEPQPPLSSRGLSADATGPFGMISISSERSVLTPLPTVQASYPGPLMAIRARGEELVAHGRSRGRDSGYAHDGRGPGRGP
jgi:hypothetical protein